jgi:hypothetical protein
MALTQVASGLIASVAASTLTGTQTIPKATLPTGSVLQVVQGTYSTQTSSTSSTWVTTNLTASITPSSSSSKVFVSVSAPVGNFSPANVAYLTIYRNSTSLAAGGMQIIYTQSGGYTVWPVAMQILDSPATTSSTSYTAYMNGADIRFCQNSLPAYITLMEISA